MTEDLPLQSGQPGKPHQCQELPHGVSQGLLDIGSRLAKTAFEKPLLPRVPCQPFTSATS